MLTDFTSYDTIRGVLGVSDAEVEDATLALPLYEQEVQFALEDLNATLPAQYATISQVVADQRTAVQKRLFNLVQVFAAYWVAKVLLNGSIELFVPRVITDGKASQERVNDPFADLRDNVNASLSVWATRIGTTLAAIDPAQTVKPITSLTLFGVATAPSDPVTGA